MSKIELIQGSCADQEADVVVNAANAGLWAGGGICGELFRRAGYEELTAACNKYKTPLMDGEAVITPAFNMKNVKAIIHAVGPDFGRTPKAFEELYNAYYNSLKVMMENGYHSIAFPLISSGIFGGNLKNPVAESTKQGCRAYKAFVKDYPDYDIDILLCVYSKGDMNWAQSEFDRNIDNSTKSYEEPNLSPEQMRAVLDSWNDGVFENRKRLDMMKTGTFKSIIETIISIIKDSSDKEDAIAKLKEFADIDE